MKRSSPAEAPVERGYLRAPDPRPLYVDTPGPVEIDLDGPALRIGVVGQARRLVPLRRVSRVIVSDTARFSTAALLACADRGIAVVLVSRDGTVRARVLGEPGERQELRQRFLDFMARPDWKDLYADWRYAVERQTVLEVRRRLRAPDDTRTPAQVRAWLTGRIAALADRKAEAQTGQWMRDFAFGWMLNHVQQLGFGSQSELTQDGWPDLVGDLSRLLAWSLEPPRLGWHLRRRCGASSNGCPARPATRGDMIRLFERHGARIGLAGREVTNRLHIWLVELA